ncbi:MAG: pilus assembly protein PilM [Planctomycetes bacterium]|nr:pilus assembly protein PilM [Planctomycetota bacterium]
MATAVGIDIGHTSIRLVALERRGEAFRLIEAVKVRTSLFDPEEQPTPVSPAAQDDGRRQRLVEEIRALKKRGLPLSRAVVGLSGRDLILKYSKAPGTQAIKVPKVMEFELREVRERSGGDITADYRLLNVPTLTDELAVLVGMVKNRALEERCDLLASAGVRPADLVPAPLGLYHAYLMSGDFRPGESVLLLDIGARNTNVVLLADGDLLFARNVSTGGAAFTQAVADEFQIPFPEAEAAKVEEGTAHPDRRGRGDDLADVLGEAADAFGGALNSAVAFARSALGAADLKVARVLLAGEAARLAGLREHLMTTFRAPVALFDPLAKVNQEGMEAQPRAALAKRGSDFATAAGLARMALTPRAFKLSFLPEAAVKRRAFLARTVWLFVAAAAMIAALVVGVRAAGTLDAQAARAASAAQLGRAEHDSLAGELDRVTAQAAETTRRARVLAQVTGPPTQFIETYDALRVVLPSGVLFMQVKYGWREEQKRAGMAARLFVEKNDQRSVAQACETFIAAAKKLPHVDQVLPAKGTSEKVREEYGEVWDFVLLFREDHRLAPER